MARILVLGDEKGGAGKSTVAMHVAARQALHALMASPGLGSVAGDMDFAAVGR